MELTGEESQAERDSRLRQGSSFGTAAAAYAEHRPGYAEAAVRWALGPGGGREPLRVLDLAAGTGKLTATLVRLGAQVTAVEPDPAMRAELRRELGSVRSLAGRAEDIPLPDASVDAVLVGQAMHWFDLPRAIPEIARVLAPGGVLAALWNVDDDRTDWVAALAQIARASRTSRCGDGGTVPPRPARSAWPRLDPACSRRPRSASSRTGSGGPSTPWWPPLRRTPTSW